MGIRFDMDGADVARDVMKMTFEAMFLPEPKKRPRAARSRTNKAR